METLTDSFLTTGQRMFWRALQGVFFVVGLVILGTLFLRPALGLHLLWNVLIPVAPALLVLAPGVWRNVCPMGTASLLPYHLKLSARRPIPRGAQRAMFATAVLLLLVIVPLRHVVLDTNGPITGAVLLAVALLAGGLGLVFSERSAWCSGLCPVYPVELLYGPRPVVTVPNAHCRACNTCVSPCRDSTDGANPRIVANRGVGHWAGTVLIGGFPGFIIGWYQVPTWQLAEGLRHLPEAFLWPWGGMLVSLVLYVVLARGLSRRQSQLTTWFAAAAVAAYYWFKLPVMVGLGNPDAALVDLGSVLPAWSVWLLRSAEILLFTGLLVLRRRPKAWQTQPPLLPGVSPSSYRAPAPGYVEA
jgi:hypothetical protein